MPAETRKVMSIIIRAKDRTARAFKTIQGNTSKLAGLGRAAFRALEVAVIGFAAAITTVAIVAMKKLISLTIDLNKNAIQTADMFESLTLQVSNLRGSAEEGERVFEELWQTAQKIPFTIDEIARSAKILEAFNLVGENVEGTMVGLADAAAIAGVSMDQMAEIMGRAMTMGTFLARGAGAIFKGMLRTKLGIDDTTASVEEFRDGVRQLLTDPQFGVAGTSRKLAETWTGIQSMIGDAVTNIKKNIAEAGLFDEIKKLGKDILEFLRTEDVLKAVKRIGEISGRVIREFRTKFADLVTSGKMTQLINRWVTQFGALAQAIVKVIANLPAIAEIIMSVVERFATVLRVFINTVNNMLGLVGFETAAEKMQTAIDNLLIAQKKERDQRKEVLRIENEIHDVRLKIADGQEHIAVINQEIKEGLGVEVVESKTLLNNTEAIFDIATERLGELVKQREEAEKQLEIQEKTVKFLKEGLSLEEIKLKLSGENKKMVEDIAALVNDILNPAGDESIKKTKTLSEQWEEIVKNIEKTSHAGARAAEAMAASFEEGFFKIMRGEFNGLLDVVNNFIMAIQRAIAQELALRAAAGIFGAGDAGAGRLPLAIGEQALFQPIESFLQPTQIGTIQELLGEDTAGTKTVINISAMDSQDVVRTMTKDPRALRAIGNFSEQTRVKG